MPSHSPDPTPDRTALADAIRRALIAAGEAAFEDAGIQGLCVEGRWEAAVAAMRSVDVAALARPAPDGSDPNAYAAP